MALGKQELASLYRKRAKRYDLTDRMLARAMERVEKRGWSDVQLVECDAVNYRFPDRVDGIFSTFAITLIPEYAHVIKNGSAALQPGKKLAVLDLKVPENWPLWLVKMGVLIMRPFGVTLDLAERKPYESINEYLTNTRFNELYFGATYLSVGEAPQCGSAEGSQPASGRSRGMGPAAQFARKRVLPTY